MKNSFQKIILYLVFPALTGCTSTMAFNPDRKFVQRSFFQEGMTTKKEILDRLGKPVAQYEEGRIITYWAEHDRKDRFRVVETLGTGNTILVIVFRNDGVLERYSVVTRR